MVRALGLGLAALVAAASGTSSATTTTNPAGTSTTAAPIVAPGPPLTITLPGDTQVFSVYDFRQDDFGAVDWPVSFVFTGKATTEKIKHGLCDATTGPWHYCDPGGDMHLFVGAPADADGTFVANAGLKRFAEHCSTHSYTAHLRIYPVPRDDDTTTRSGPYGDVVLGTAHLDFEDRGGCSSRVHGYPDVAESWLIDAMRTMPGWEIRPDAFDLGNGSTDYVVLRDLGGHLTPHVYGSDGKATQVVIP